MIKDLKDYIAPLSVTVVILSIIKQIIYYKGFNLPIKYFIGLSEIAMAVSDDLIIIIPLCLALIGVAFLYIFISNKSIKKKLVKENSSLTINEYIQSKKPIKTFNIILIITFCFALTLFFITKDYGLKLYNVILCTVTFLCFIMKNFLKQSGMAKDTVLYGGIFLYLLIFVLQHTALEIRQVNRGKYKGTEILMKDSTLYKSNDSTYFIGKTDKYIFQYQKFNNTTIILPTDDVKKITLRIK